MATIHPTYPMIDPQDRPFVQGFKAFFQGYYNTSGREYRIIKSGIPNYVIEEEARPSSSTKTFLKVFSVFTGIIPLLAALWLAYHSATCNKRFAISAKQLDDQSTSRVIDPRVSGPLKTMDATKLVEPTTQDSLLKARELEALLDDLLKNLRKLNSEEETSLGPKLKQYRESFGEALQGNTKEAVIFNHVSEVFEGLKKIQKNLFSFPKLVTNREDVIIENPGDGNCLFHAFGRGLGFYQDHVLDHTALRAQAVEWMEQHYAEDEILQLYVLNAVGCYQEAIKEHANFELQSLQGALESGLIEKAEHDSQQKEVLEQLGSVENISLPNGYFDLIRTNGFFASNAEFYALSQIYNCQIKILRKVNDQLVSYDDTLNRHIESPVISVLHVNGNHFDLIVPYQ